MKQILLTLILVLSILSISSATQQPKPQQWEYKVMLKRCNDEKTLNVLGGEGWELATYSTWPLGAAGAIDTCVLKRAR
jgi:hypothetical protein